MAKDTTADATYTPQFFMPDVYSVQNYYAFGQSMPNWSGTAAVNDPKKYRFGYNGKEDDDEWGKQDYGFRISDPRIGRFLSVDPIASTYPELTPYQFASNRPIDGIDLEGLEHYWLADGHYKGSVGTSQEVFVVADKYATYKDAQAVHDEVHKDAGLYKKLDITQEQLVNRMHWAYGEGGGDAPDYYAHAINNLSKKEGEEGMYKHMNEGVKATNKENKRKYFEADAGNGNYARFRKYKTGVSDFRLTTAEAAKAKNGKQGDNLPLSFYKNSILGVQKATLDALTGVTDDVTGGRYSWAGGKGTIMHARRFNDNDEGILVVSVSNKYGNTSWNVFYIENQKLNRETLQGYRQISYDKAGRVSTIEIGQEANPHYKKPKKD